MALTETWLGRVLDVLEGLSLVENHTGDP